MTKSSAGSTDDRARPQISIVTSGHDVADARIHRVCAALLDAGLTVELLGLGDAATGPPRVAVTTRERPGVIGRAWLAGRQAIRARGRVLVAMDPDSLVASFVVARVRRRGLVADVHEDYTALLADRSWATGWRGRVALALVGVATNVARRADVVVVADEHVPPLDGRSRLVLRNVPYLRMLPAKEGNTPPDNRALYVGDVRASRGLWSMVEAIEAAPGWTLDVVGPVAREDAPRVEAYQRTGPARDRVRFHGRKPPREAWALAARARCGFTLLADTPAFRAAMPSKLYEYVACGLPVIVTDLPRQRQFVEDWGAGAIVPPGPDTGSRASAVLREWSENPAALDAIRNSASRFHAEAAQWAAEYEVVAEAIARIAANAR